ncbi:MAG: hypothetical protein K6E76_02975 [Patescibacteria group bacterium]|nr:hypothetical protein [Patescibacteria group bacterium]
MFIDFNENGEVRILRRREIVEEVEDAETQMTLADAKEVAGDDMTVGEFVWSEVTPETMELSRIATIAAAQTITQNLKAVEKENFQTKFKDKEGKLLKAVVTKVAESNILLEIEGNPIILPPEGQIPQKKYTEGEEIFVFLKGYGKDMLPDISQTNKEYVEAILKMLVPEIEEGTIVIEKIARRAGIRTKILVRSTDSKIDPVGTMVGVGAERVQQINSLLSYKIEGKEDEKSDGLEGSEKIEFIGYTDNKEELIKRALKPAEVENITYKTTNDGEIAVVHVKNGQQALAI